MNNPYSRFSTVASTGSASIIIAGLAFFGLPAFDAIAALAGNTGPAVMGAVGAAVTVLVVFWLTLNEAIFPMLFRSTAVRKMVLGKYYLEGTWLQAERSKETKRMAVIDIQPNGKNFIFSGYTLNEDLETEANTLIEFSKFEWPFMTYKYRNSLSDGSDGQREGIGELQFEMNREAARRYNGFLQYVKASERLRIEGAKLTKGREVKKLRTLEGRQDVFEKYWKLFFQRSMKPASGTLAARVADMQQERIVHRRRATDWPTSADAGPVIVPPASDEVDVDDLETPDTLKSLDLQTLEPTGS